MRSTCKTWVGALTLLAVVTTASYLYSVEPKAKKAAAPKSKAPAEAKSESYDPTAEALKVIATLKVKSSDWPQWGGSYFRNNTPDAQNIPTEWNLKTGQNIKWTAALGSQSYGNPVVANGQVYVGTNNGAGYIKRYPDKVDLGCLIAFTEADGKFLWQHSSEKLPAGRVNDWPEMGVCAAPFVDGERLWYVNNRGEVCCLDTQGFHDDENDGPYKDEPYDTKEEADVIWKLDMMKQLGISQHNMCNCSLTAIDGVLFVNTSNGVDESHVVIPQPSAPSFAALDQATGKVLWTDNTPGKNVLHGQWSSPAYGVFDGQAQVIFGGGDGWLYSFDPKGDGKGKAKMLWSFDCNPKDSKYVLGGRATRNHLIATPVVYEGLVYVGVGEDPEHGEGVGHLWCVDPTKRGDVSTEQVFNTSDPMKIVPHKRLQAADKAANDFTRENPNSAAVWHYSTVDLNNNKKIEFEETMHRTCGTVAIKDGLLFVADFSGLFHCVDAKTGEQQWTHDMLAAAWGSPLIVGGHVYIGDEDGDVTVLKVDRKLEVVSEINMGNAVLSTPIVANNVLYITNKDRLFAIEEGAKLDPASISKSKPSESEEE